MIYFVPIEVITIMSVINMFTSFKPDGVGSFARFDGEPVSQAIDFDLLTRFAFVPGGVLDSSLMFIPLGSSADLVVR